MKDGCNSNTVTLLAVVLLVVGGLNWGLVGAFEYNLVNALVGTWPVVERVVYVLVGLAAVWKAGKMAMGCSK